MNQKRRTKIVATLGPATSSEEMLSRLIGVGANIIRLNFSHGSHKEHKAAIQSIRAIAEKRGMVVAILQDLQGPKVRIAELKAPSYLLKRKAFFTFLKDPVLGDDRAAASDFPELYKKVHPGDAILINDGRIILKVIEIVRGEIRCQVVEGGLLQAHKGVNVPGRDLGFPSLTEKDQRDLAFGLANGVDYVALSMVRTANDVLALKKLIEGANKDVPVIAKLEQAMAIQHLEEIMAVADGVMIARGDLGVELPLEQVPILQKEIIKMANKAHVPVITATQMLESMVDNARPTRAEVSDVANAIYDGTDAVMLSGETASGKHPIKSVQIMSRIITTVENHIPIQHLHLEKKLTPPAAVSHAACILSYQIGAKAIVTSTLSGGSALRLSKYRPKVPIIAFTPNPEVKRRMALFWGVEPYDMRLLKRMDDVLEAMVKGVRSVKAAKKGDVLVMVSQSPRGRLNIKRALPTDLIKVYRMRS